MKKRRRKVSPQERRVRYAVRKSIYLLAAAVIIIGLILADRAGLFGLAPKSDWEKYHNKQFKVVHIVDGDTIDVDCPDGRFRHTRIRLLGVDTPETVKPNTPVQYYGPEARRFTEQMAYGKIVTLKLDRMRTRDRYNRLLAYVILPDGRNLNLQIIAQGYGYADPRFDHPLKRQFKLAQDEARKHLRGLWKGISENSLPYYYRGKIKLPSQDKKF